MLRPDADTDLVLAAFVLLALVVYLVARFA
jgi:hypothetical protein